MHLWLLSSSTNNGPEVNDTRLKGEHLSVGVPLIRKRHGGHVEALTTCLVENLSEALCCCEDLQ